MSDANQTTPDTSFVMQCRDAIRTMREAGLNEVLIGCVVTEIRSAAISEERRRMDRLTQDNPPTHFPHGAMMEAINAR